jgi:hypothetical protein
MKYVLRVIHTLSTPRFIVVRALLNLTHRPVIPYLRVQPRLLCTMADHEPKPRTAYPGPAIGADDKTIHERAKKNKKDKKNDGVSPLEVCFGNFVYKDGDSHCSSIPFLISSNIESKSLNNIGRSTKATLQVASSLLYARTLCLQ